MNVLAAGFPFREGWDAWKTWKSSAGHSLRLLGVEGPCEQFRPDESAADAVSRIGQSWKPDLLLCWCPEMYPPPLAVEECPIRTVAVVSDWNLYQPQLEHNLARFDIVVSDRPGVERLKLVDAQPRFWQPIYNHRPAIHRDLGLTRDLDVVFLGNLNHAVHRRRGKVLERVAALGDRYRVVIDGEKPQAEYAHTMNRARIVVNCTLRGEMNLRCFEAPACGALLFVEEDNREIRDVLRDRQEVILYNPDNLTELIAHYLAHEDERASIAKAGQERVTAFAPLQRMDGLLHWIAAQAPDTRRFKELPAETRAMADVLLYGSSMAAPQRHWAHARAATLRAENPASQAAVLAAACAALDRARDASAAARQVALEDAVRSMREAAEIDPREAVPWMNLAFIALRLDQPALQRQYLDRARDATEANHRGFLLGENADPYYADWRLACALGEARVSLLQAYAAMRLAEWHLVHGAPAEAATHAARSIALHPGVAQPYRYAAIAHSRLGDLDAAHAMLAAGLEHSAFDHDMRRDLVRVLGALGRVDEARALARATAHLLRACPGLAPIAGEFDSVA